jgi:hypothetical protein
LCSRVPHRRPDGKPDGDGARRAVRSVPAGVDHWVVRGLTVTNVVSGIVLDRTTHMTLENTECRLR